MMKSIAYMEFKGSTSLYPFLRTALQLGILLNMGHWLFFAGNPLIIDSVGRRFFLLTA